MGSGFALLVTAVGLLLFGSTLSPESRSSISVLGLLPDPPPGWILEQRSLADSPEMRQKVGEILNFDDAVFVDYRSPRSDRLSVYIAYWGAGRMSIKDVARHTPDVCWVENGWKLEAASHLSTWTDVTGSIPIAESRVFSVGGTREHVLFWHVVGRQAVSYGTIGRPPWYAMLADIWRDGMNQREEQFFIRLSSARPLGSENLRPVIDPLVATVRALVDFGPE